MKEIKNNVLNWASNLDENTLAQAELSARSPVLSGHIALMPDAHFGLGATVGSVIPTENAIIPSAVGVDIGCGMIAALTDLNASDLPDSLDQLHHSISRSIPAGLGEWHTEPSERAVRWMSAHLLQPHVDVDLNKMQSRAVNQLGSLGSGNHFLEVCLDEKDQVWVVLHSGSRGVGNVLAHQHIKKATHLAGQLNRMLEDPDLAYFLDTDEGYQDYIKDMLWSQAYALANREIMMNVALKDLFHEVGKGAAIDRINCHHNFTVRERHYGKDMWITRKGAIKADVGDMGVIPGSMGDRSFIVKGLGDPASYNSSAHGAGRRMSRGQARRTLTEDSLRERMKGKAWNDQAALDLLDEHPDAYKSIDQVMDDQKDLVEIVSVLHQVLNYKGVDTKKRRR